MSKQTRSRLVLGFLTFSYLAAICVLAFDSSHLHRTDKVHPINFGRLAPGMTRAEVEAVLGEERAQASYFGVVGGDTWLGHRFMIDLAFDHEGLLVSKTITSLGDRALFFERAYVWLNGW